MRDRLNPFVDLVDYDDINEHKYDYPNINEPVDARIPDV